MSRHSHLVSITSLLSNAAALHTGFLIFGYISAPRGDTVGLLLWWLCLGGTYGGLALFLRKDRSLRGVILLLVGGFAVQLVLTPAFGVRYPTVLGWLFLLLLWGGMYYRCWLVLQQPVPPEQLMLSFEMAVLALFVAVFLVSTGLLSSVVLGHLAVAVVLSLVSMAHQRTGGLRLASDGQGLLRGRGVLILLPMAAAGAALVCILSFAGQVSALVTKAGELLKAAGTALLQGIYSVMKFLVSLIPKEDAELLEGLEGTGEMSLEGGASSELQYESDFMMYLLVGTVIAAALAAVVYLLVKNGGGHRVSATRGAGNQHRIGGGWKLFLRRLGEKLRFWFRYLRCRNTPPGLFIWLERKLHRQSEETPRAFLTRCGAELPRCAGDLLALADWLDEYYFASRPPAGSFPVREIRRKIRKGHWAEKSS